MTWTHLDHQGSAVAATNASGTKLWEERYLPFGEKLIDPSANQDRPGYTGHVQDSWSGLTYMQARYYDPVLGRFMQTDPIGYQDQMNLYAYVHNDPINKTDPTGQQAMEEPVRRLKKVVVKRLKKKIIEGIGRMVTRRLARNLTREKLTDAGKNAGKKVLCNAPKVGGTVGADAYNIGGLTVQGGPSVDFQKGQVSLFGSVGVGLGTSLPAGAPVPGPTPFGTIVLNPPTGLSADITANATAGFRHVSGSVSKSLVGSSQGETSYSVVKMTVGASANANIAGQVSLPITPSAYDLECPSND